MNLLVLLETSLDSVGDTLGSLQVELDVDLVAGSVSKVIQDLVLLLLCRSGTLLLSAVSTLFQCLAKLGILALSLSAHLLNHVVLEVLELVEKSLLFAIVVLTPGNLLSDLVAGLLHLKLLLGILLVKITEDTSDGSVFFRAFLLPSGCLSVTRS